MFDKKKFKAQVILSGKTLQEVADLLGVNIATLYRKMNGESDFYRNEIQLLCESLNIKNPAEIFFAEKIT
ncbi:helix-turn-helix domain-containing protein [Geosporobacter ferrireducens]|uniref:helix-turn-helix domain-containing protein n=1 Tax=Geosporobacter ferrireducens TaxID=1424294 RepID=UPI00139CD55A|nr:XRE family transcriptional regulator [Geosporobacter ferrireducens]MTI56122.1 XRE family transcriptional regulator [Geosporobacter ferrireducens]